MISTVPKQGGGDVPTRGLPAIPSGKWVDVIVHVKFSATAGKALAEVWIDGKQIYKSTVPTLFAGQTSYAKIGVYNWGFKLSKNASITQYIDEFKGWVIVK